MLSGSSIFEWLIPVSNVVAYIHDTENHIKTYFLSFYFTQFDMIYMCYNYNTLLNNEQTNEQKKNANSEEIFCTSFGSYILRSLCSLFKTGFSKVLHFSIEVYYLFCLLFGVQVHCIPKKLLSCMDFATAERCFRCW